MDPWFDCQQDVTVSEPLSAKFEDNFQPETDKLPDHHQYLASLENKLTRLKSDPNVLRQLAQKRNQYMNELLNGEPEYNLELTSLQEPVEESKVLRHIAPQKQALTQGEVVEFIKFDQLRDTEDN